MWTHNAGNETELGAINAIVTDYNASQTKYKVEVQAFPQDSYNTSVTAAAASKSAAVHPGHRRPERAELGVGRISRPADRPGRHAVEVPAQHGRQLQRTRPYSVGYYDVALAMYARKSVLEQNNIRIPTIDQPWTADEFTAALATLKATGKWAIPAGHGDRRAPASGGPTPTRRSCRASAAT